METIKLSIEQCQKLFGHIEQSNLVIDDQYLIKRIISAYLTLESALKEKNISIKRLKEIAFGQKKCKSYGIKSSNNNNPIVNNNGSNNTLNSNKGKIAATSYTAAEMVNVKHEALQSGDECPLYCGGKVYPFKPGHQIKISGGAIAKATMYQLERLRCNTYGKLFTAKLPTGVSNAKYDSSFIANLAVRCKSCLRIKLAWNRSLASTS